MVEELAYLFFLKILYSLHQQLESINRSRITISEFQEIITPQKSYIMTNSKWHLISMKFNFNFKILQIRIFIKCFFHGEHLFLHFKMKWIIFSSVGCPHRNKERLKTPKTWISAGTWLPCCGTGKLCHPWWDSWHVALWLWMPWPLKLQTTKVSVLLFREVLENQAISKEHAD